MFAAVYLFIIYELDLKQQFKFNRESKQSCWLSLSFHTRFLLEQFKFNQNLFYSTMYILKKKKKLHDSGSSPLEVVWGLLSVDNVCPCDLWCALLTYEWLWCHVRSGHDNELPVQRARNHQLPIWEGPAVATLQRRTRPAQVMMTTQRQPRSPLWIVLLVVAV